MVEPPLPRAMPPNVGAMETASFGSPGFVSRNFACASRNDHPRPQAEVDALGDAVPHRAVEVRVGNQGRARADRLHARLDGGLHVAFAERVSALNVADRRTARRQAQHHRVGGSHEGI